MADVGTTDKKFGTAGTTVSVVITTFNHARYLSQAIESVYGQTVKADEIIVVDDGSRDNPGKVVQKHPQISMVRQANGGTSAARNSGLRLSRSRYVIFLDADDKLLPGAVAAGLQAHKANPGAAFVYGGHRRVDSAGRHLNGDCHSGLEKPFRDLLLGNQVAMHGAVMFDRGILALSGGYDESLVVCEDYDVYLRLARMHPVGSHRETVAEYRMHNLNISSDQSRMLEIVLSVLARHSVGLTKEEQQASQEGERNWRQYYSAQRRTVEPSLPAQGGAKWRRIKSGARSIKGGAKTLMKLALSSVPVIGSHSSAHQVPIGRWRMGDFARTTPASKDFGFDRGTPIDRYFIERFLEDCRTDIKGCVLEVGDSTYSRRFGGSRVTRQEVLHIDGDNSSATIVGDISSQPSVLPRSQIDCAIITQTLQLVYDLPTAVANLKQSLRPGGVALLTVPGITPIERGRWGNIWYWSLTGVSAMRLFSEVFGADAVSVTVHGNVYAAVSVLEGLALSEVDREKLDEIDPAFPVLITIRAVNVA